jgi:hypothetical protein
MSDTDSGSKDESGSAGFFGKLVMTAIVLALTPFTELVTGAAPIGSLGALTALAVIWGFEDEAEDLQEAT